MAVSSHFNGKVVVITGGASGIGQAVATRFTEHGSHVVIGDVDADRGERVARDLGARFVRTDVASIEDSAALMDSAVAWYGRLDIVHLNAGIIGATTVGDVFDLDAYRRIVAVNFDSVVFGIQAALPHFRRAGGGSLVVTASAAALRPSIEMFYSATKSAVIGLVRSLGPVLAEHGITVNALCPGLVDTPLIDSRRSAVSAAGVPVAPTGLVVDALESAVSSGKTGQAWLIMAGHEIAPFQFTELPVPGADQLRYRDGLLIADVGA